MNATLKQKISPLVVYHANCLDGFGAAWVFHHFGKIVEVDFEFHAAVYGEPMPDVAGRDVYFVDFCLPWDRLQDVAALANSVTVIDHHPLALEVAELTRTRHLVNTKPIHVCVDAKNGGAALAWMYWQDWMVREGDYMAGTPPSVIKYIPSAPPALIKHIEDRDLWRFALPQTKELMAALQVQEMDFGLWDKLMDLEGRSLTYFAHTGREILKGHEKNCKVIIASSRRIIAIRKTSDTYMNIPVCSAPGYMASDIGNALSDSYEDGTKFAATYYDTSHHRVFSLRSQKHGMDVNAIAKLYGGGGHVNAAGFSVPRSHHLAQV